MSHSNLPNNLVTLQQNQSIFSLVVSKLDPTTIIPLQVLRFLNKIHNIFKFKSRLFSFLIVDDLIDMFGKIKAKLVMKLIV